MANILALTAGDWHTGSNWEGGVVPTATDVAILNGKVMTLVSGASITCSSIEGGTALESLVSAIKAKTDQLTFTGGNVNAVSESVPLVTVANAIADGSWSSASIWDTGVVPDASTFVYTNGKAITVSNTVNCAGYADTPSGGDGVVVDEDGNAVLVNSFGDALLPDTKVLAALQGNLSNVGSATLTANNYAMGYSTAPVALFGRTQFARKSAFDDPIRAGVVFPMPEVNNSVGLTVEFWWYPLADNNGTFFASSYLGLIPTYDALEFFSGASGYTQIGGSRVALTGLAPITTQWNHCVIQRTKAGAVEVYVNGLRVMNQTSSPAIAAGNWRLFAAEPNYYAGLWGYFSELRVTLSASGTRYNGNFTVPTAPFIDYAPPPGASLTGRLILQDNGAVIQSTVAPTVSVAGILSSLSRFTRAYIGQVGTDTGAIKAKTDLLTFGSTGVVTEDTSGGGIDYTSRFDDLDVAVAAIPTLTYTARLNSIDTDLGNLIANNMRNSLVAGVVSSTDFIGLLDDTSAELSGGTPAYQREAVVWSSPFNGIVTNTTDITINVPAGGNVAYIAGYTLVTGGTAQFSYACAEVDAVSQSVYTIPAGTLQMTTTVQ